MFCLLNTTGKAFERQHRPRGLCNAEIWPKRMLRGLICPGTVGVDAVQGPWGDWRGSENVPSYLAALAFQCAGKIGEVKGFYGEGAGGLTIRG